MSTRLDLINALSQLSDNCKLVSRLLSEDNILDMVYQDQSHIALPNTSVSLEIAQYESWPKADDNVITHWLMKARIIASTIPWDISDSQVLEVTAGDSIPVSYIYPNTEVDLYHETYPFGDDIPPANLRLMGAITDCNDNKIYDIGVIYESYEFMKNPLDVILFMKKKIKHNGKIYIRFRPWTSIDGGFISTFKNMAFIHLLTSADSNVINRVVKPLSIYNNLFTKLSLPVLSRQIKSSKPPAEITRDDQIMNTIITRTWGDIPREEAVKIMSTQYIDYLLLT